MGIGQVVGWNPIRSTKPAGGGTEQPADTGLGELDARTPRRHGEEGRTVVCIYTAEHIIGEILYRELSGST